MAKILLTSPTYPPFNSGLGNAAAQQALQLSRFGHEVIVATGGQMRASWDDEGVRVEVFSVRGSGNCLQPIRGDVQSYVDFLTSNNWDVVLLNAWQNWATDLVLLRAKEISGRKFVYSHCISTNIFYLKHPLLSIFRYLVWRPYWWRLAGLMKRLDGVIFLASEGTDSRFDDLRLALQHGVRPWIVPNSLSSVAVEALEKTANPFFARDRLISVGSYEWKKGFDFVLRAYAASQARHDYSLHLYGQKFTSYTSVLKALACKLGVGENVVFHERVSGSSLIDAYGQAKLVLSGSYTECQPLVLLDAIATGTPFVARETGCIASMPGGQVVQNWRQMAVCIDSLVNLDVSWQVLSEAGRLAARARYHPIVNFERLRFALALGSTGIACSAQNE